MTRQMKLSRRKLLELKNKGVIRPRLDGSMEQVDRIDEAVPAPVSDTEKRSWKVRVHERDFEGYIESVIISEL